MLKFLSILGWAWFSMAVMVPGPDAGGRGWDGLSEVPLTPLPHPARIQITMEKADTGPAGHRPERNTRDSDPHGVIVRDIQFVTEKSGTEKVCFLLNPFCNPQVFSLEGSSPRIVIDIENVHSWKGKSKIPAEGVLIRQVRTHFYRDQNKLRIVLDLRPSMDYTAEPLYYKAEGIYCMAVAAK